VVIKPFAFFLVLAPALFHFCVLAHFPSLAFVFCFCCVLRSSSLKKKRRCSHHFSGVHAPGSNARVETRPPQVGQTTKGKSKRRGFQFSEQQVSHQLVELVPAKQRLKRRPQIKKILPALCKKIRLLYLACGW
jgi:hypothetical protein